MSVLHIVEPGLHTSIQDRGRFGYQRYGIPVCGALDLEALELANALVGSRAGSAALEIRYVGPVFDVLAKRARIAFVGAQIAARFIRDGETQVLSADRTISLRRGDRVVTGPLRGSTTAILAIAGGIDVPDVLGSRSTFTKAGMGGLNGRPLAAGDLLPLCADDSGDAPDLGLEYPFELAPPRRFRVVLGPQAEAFSDKAIETFLSADWAISRNADRMGLRLEHLAEERTHSLDRNMRQINEPDRPILDHVNGYNITSDGIVAGAIQVPGTGQPIVLLADRQTSGGYPKIATVISTDLPALGRAGPTAILKFEAVAPADAVHIARQRRRVIDAIVESIAPYRPIGEIDIDALYTNNLISPSIEGN